jgi:putative ABC transport system ATP-binding protein
VTTDLVRLVDLRRTYRLEDGRGVEVLKGITLTIRRGDFVALMGPSGSGKSTLMQVIGGLDRPDGGAYHLEDQDLLALDDDQLSRLRGRRLGFVFQAFNLIPQMDLIENVALPLLYAGEEDAPARLRAVASLERVGLGHRLDHRPTQLSGGEQQRAAIARALVTDPILLLGDEPTGNLDTRTSDEIMGLFADLNARGLTILLVTHDPHVAAAAHRTVRMRDGRLVEEEAS